MKAKKLFLTLCAVVFFLIGCENDKTFITESEPDAMLKSSKIVTKNLVFRNLQGTFTYEVNPESEEFPSYAKTNGTGNATHLGFIHFQHTYLCNADGWPIIYVGGFVEAANRDKIYTMATDSWTDPQSGINYTNYDIINGTGRFEGASGTITMGVVIDWVSSTFTAEGYGTISY
jgi:hypothetical protein